MNKLETTVCDALRAQARLKQKHAEFVFLFKIGDYYECYREDSTIVSRILCIQTTHRKNEVGAHIAMAAIPAHSLETNLVRIIRAGQRVAIAEAAP